MNSLSAVGLDKKVIRKQIYLMIFPIIIENVLQLCASLVSMSMLGRISVTAVSAQGVSSLLTGIIWNFFKGITIGATVMIATAHGSGDEKRIRLIGQQTIMTLLVLSLILQFLVRLFRYNLLSLFNPEAHIMETAQAYLRIVSFGFPFVCIMLCVTGFLQGRGDAKTPMLIATLMNIVNIAISGTLIFGLFGVRPMGLVGAAIGLISAQGAGAVAGLFVLFRKGGLLYGAFRRDNFTIRFDIIREVFRIGIPSGLETIFWQAASIVLSRVILSFGDIAFAANQMGLQAESISEMPALGFGVAATAFTGQAVGACNSELGKEYIRQIQHGAMLVISFGTCMLLFFPHVAMRFLTNDSQVIELGAIYLRLMGLIQIPQNLQRVYTGSLKGAGYTKIPMLIAGIGLWGIRIPLALLLTGVFHTSIIGIWVVVCVDQTVRFILSLLLYKKKKIWNSELPVN